MDRQQLTLGYDEFKEIIHEDLYYVDKTSMIQELLESSGKVILISRPRRFGNKFSQVRKWYDGYRFGMSEIYNPWSIISYIKNAMVQDFTPKAYWSNTSSKDNLWNFLFFTGYLKAEEQRSED